MSPIKSQNSETKQLPDLDDGTDVMVTSTIQFTEEMYKDLGVIAVKKGVSRASIIRELLKDYIAKAKKEQANKTSPTISNKELQAVLDGSKGFFGGVDVNKIMDGFDQHDWKLNELTDSQFYDVCQWLRAGYEAIKNQMSVDEVTTVIEKRLEPTEEQSELLTYYLDDKFTFDDNDDYDKPIDTLLEEVKAIVEKSEEQEG